MSALFLTVEHTSLMSLRRVARRRYVGDRPEMCALDFHLFADLEYAVTQNVLVTSWLPLGDKRRFDNGTPAELSSAIRRTWQQHPLPERIVEDMTRLPVVLDKIIEAEGGLSQTMRCSTMAAV
jgi:hypothetical protein